MIFVTMTSEELARTAQYQIQYSSSGRRHNRRRMLALPSQEYLNSYRAPLQSLERTVLRGPDSLATTDNETTDPNTADPQAEFRVSTDYNENTEDSIFYNQEDEGPSEADLERMQEEEGLFSDSDETPSEDEEEEEEEEDIETNILNRRHRELQRRIGSIRRGWPNPETRRQGQPSLIDPIPPPPNGSGGASGSEVLKPHARFFIEREKSMVSIKFDPPPYVPILSCLSPTPHISVH